MVVEVCKAWKRKLTKYAPCLRIEHLIHCLLEAEANEHVERAKAIRAMISREDQRGMWQLMNFTFQDNGGRSNAVTQVERVKDGVTADYTERIEVEQVVREMTQNHFTLADSSPLCNGLLVDELGYLANTEIASSILDGSYEPSDGVSDVTVLVLNEIDRIAGQLCQGGINFEVNPEEFSIYWRAMKESTSSSYSKVHLQHSLLKS